MILLIKSNQHKKFKKYGHMYLAEKQMDGQTEKNPFPMWIVGRGIKIDCDF